MNLDLKVVSVMGNSNKHKPIGLLKNTKFIIIMKMIKNVDPKGHSLITSLHSTSTWDI